MSPTTLVNFRLDQDTKRSMESVCRDLGMSMTTAFTLFAKKVDRERRIPFDVSLDGTPLPARRSPWQSAQTMQIRRHCRRRHTCLWRGAGRGERLTAQRLSCAEANSLPSRAPPVPASRPCCTSSAAWMPPPRVAWSWTAWTSRRSAPTLWRSIA